MPKVGVVSYQWAELDENGELIGDMVDYYQSSGDGMGLIAFIDNKEVELDEVIYVTLDEWKEAFNEAV
jgi:hypothetical protein